MSINDNSVVETEAILAESLQALTMPQVDYDNLGFKRVDFDRPDTIISYGEDILDDMSSIVSASARVSRIEEVPDDEFYNAVDRLRGFIDQLDKVDEQRNHKPGVMTKALVSVGSKFKPDMKKKLEPKTYADEFREYDETIDEIARGVQKQGENTYAQFQFTRDSISKIKPLIDKLGNALVVGKNDRDSYSEKVIRRLQDEISEYPNDPTKLREFNEKNIYLTSFNEQLDALGSAYVKFNNIVNQWNITQQGDFTLMKENKKYLGIEVPAMRTHGQVVVTTRRQARAIQRQNELIEAGQEILMNTSDQINQNILDIVDLEKKSMSMSPLDYVASNIDKGLTLYEEAKKTKKALIEENEKHVEELKLAFEDYSHRIKALHSLSPEATHGVYHKFWG